MASSQNERYLERLAARQRGAGTHKIQNLGFSIQPLAPPARPAVAPPPAEAPPLKQATPPAGPVRRSPRTTPTPPPHPSGEKRKAGPSSLRNETSSGPEETPAAALPRRVSPRTQNTTAITQIRSSSSPIDTPTNFTATKASTRANATKPAVAAVTPVPRGKRTRQPSPGKFVNTPEEPTWNGRSSSAAIDGVPESETSTVIERSPEGSKRRKVVKEVGASLDVGVVGGDDEDEIVGEQTIEQSVIEKTLDEEEEAGADATMLETPVQNLDKSQPPPNSSPPLFLGGQDSSEEEGEAEPGSTQPKPQNPPKSELAGKRIPPLLEPEEERVDENPQLGSAEKGRDLQLSDEEQENEDESEAEEPAPRVTKKASKSIAARNKPKPKPPKDTDEYEHGPTTFPVVVHRLAKGGASAKLPAGSQRSGVNPVDVISQVATELIDKFYQRLKGGVEKKAVESFKEELSLRFLELTDALEHSIILADRVRKAQRRKNQLMAELLAIKRERTQVAVQMDDVRRDHEIASKRSDTQNQTSQLFEEISGALERGKSRAHNGDNERDHTGTTSLEGLEGLVRRVSAIVTGGGRDGTGVLGKVVEFNDFLEKAERVLRERNAGGVTAATVAR
ncbi:hypothetical protein HOY82DRAFT_572466 [Tuber indicum]|nr:hypothetical protein HOY82DRAFT_572466 [Tuber indicum]